MACGKFVYGDLMTDTSFGVRPEFHQRRMLPAMFGTAIFVPCKGISYSAISYLALSRLLIFAVQLVSSCSNGKHGICCIVRFHPAHGSV